jgi:hypothetical protein
MTCVGDQSPLQAAGIRRSLSPTAMARSEVVPAVCISAMIGARSAALAEAIAAVAALPASRILRVIFAPQ